MAKYSFEFKLKVVKDYLEGKGGYKHLASSHGVKNERQVRNWVNSYREFGEEGLFYLTFFRLKTAIKHRIIGCFRVENYNTH